MGETMHSNIRVGAKSESKRAKKCKLQNAKLGQKSNDAITIIVIPSIDEDKKRGHDGDTGIMTANKAFDKQNYDYHNFNVNSMALDKDKGSPAKQFRKAFEDTNIQKGLVNFLVAIGRPGTLHNPLAPKIDLDFKPATQKTQQGIPTDIETIGISKKRSGISLGVVVNFMKQLVLNMRSWRHNNEKPTTPKEPKPTTRTTFFPPTKEFNLSQVQQAKPIGKPTVTMGDAYKSAGFLNGPNNDSTFSADMKKATESIIPSALT